MQSISCNRTWALHQGLQLYFDDVFVISTSNRHLLPQDPMDTSEVHIADARTIDYRTLFQKNGRTAVSGEKMKSSRTGRTLARLQSSFPTLHIFGEGNIVYTQGAVRAAVKFIEDHQITHVFSTFPPYADHLIAARLKRRFPSLFWIADFRDLHVDPAQDNWIWKEYQIRMNRKILAGADMVTTVSSGLADHLKSLHTNVVVLKNGMRTQTQPETELFPKFTIAYTGSMFQDKRRPDSLLQAIRQLLDEEVLLPDEIELVYAGKDSTVWWPLVRDAGLDHVFVDRGLLSSAAARTIQSRSHLNLLLTYSTPELKGNLTGKLYDYLSAGRPYLVLINGPDDPEIEALVSETRSGLVMYHGDVPRAKQIITEAWQQWKTGSGPTQEVPAETLAHFSWEHVLGAFAEYNGWRPVAHD
jgi:hypothetical protein